MSSLLAPIEIQRPSALHFGSGVAGRIGAWAHAQGFARILVVADAFNAGRVDVLKLPLQVTVFADVRPEPDIANLQALLDMAQATRPDLVVGFGGGSAMDLAKLAAVLPGSGQTLHDVVGAEKVIGRRIALAQLPTTAGTGSEAGTRALITDPATRQKLAVQSRHMLADIALIDPDLTLTVPATVTAATGLDALAHCVEAYTSRKAHPLIDVYALEGARLVGAFLTRAVRDGTDREARAGLALASLYGGFCLGPVNTTAGHALAYPLGTRHGLPHGLACALMFPHALACNAAATPEKTAAILQALNLPAARERAAIRDSTRNFCAVLSLDMRLSTHGILRPDLQEMATEAFAIRRLLDNNPVDLNVDAILALYQDAL